MESSPGGFADALRRWRRRRRVSQLELALRAGTTQRYLSFLEQGRAAPGRGIVVRLAESLELPLRERNALLLAAGYAPVYPQTSLDDPGLASVRTSLQRILDGHLPYPAIVINRHGDLLAANDAVDVLTEGAAPELLTPPINVLRLALHPAGMAGRVANFPQWAQHVVERLRVESVRNPDERTDALLAELEQYVPPPDRNADHPGFAVPVRLRWRDAELRLMTTITTFATAVDVTVAELKLEAFLPADQDSAAALTEAAAHRAGTPVPA